MADTQLSRSELDLQEPCLKLCTLLPGVYVADSGGPRRRRVHVQRRRFRPSDVRPPRRLRRWRGRLLPSEVSLHRVSYQMKHRPPLRVPNIVS